MLSLKIKGFGFKVSTISSPFQKYYIAKHDIGQFHSYHQSASVTDPTFTLGAACFGCPV